MGYILETILGEFDFKSIKVTKLGTEEGFDEEIQVILNDRLDVKKFEKVCKGYLTGEFGTYKKVTTVEPVFKQMCIGFINENISSTNKVPLCSHYRDGKCAFFLNNINCDDIENEQLRSQTY